MTDDFESTIKTLLDEYVNQQVGPRRPAPQFALGRTSSVSAPRRRPGWLFPLLAAACVVVAVAIALTVTHLVSDSDQAPPIGPPSSSSATLPTPSPSAPSPTTSTSPAPTQSDNRSSSTPAAATRHVVDLDGASISLPRGMVAVRETTSSPTVRSWCLHDQAARTGTCPASISERLVVSGQTLYLDPDFRGAGYGDVGEESCAPSGVGNDPPNQTEQTGIRTFGGRSAEWRLWQDHCTSISRQWRFEQYTVVTDPAWVLFSDSTNAGTSSLLAGIAANSVLPNQARPERLVDRGILRSVRAVGSSVNISIDRVIDEHTGTINSSPQTYQYTVPKAMYDAAGVKVGVAVEVTTDGYLTTSFRKD